MKAISAFPVSAPPVTWRTRIPGKGSRAGLPAGARRYSSPSRKMVSYMVTMLHVGVMG